MKNTTLCYIERDGKYLMLHRSSKKNDGSQGKWMGIGGHFEEGESPYECVVREVKEETGFKLISPQYRAVVTFDSDEYESEQMHLFTCCEFTGKLIDCNEGDLHWIDKKEVKSLNMWNGDLIFLELLETEKSFFSLKLKYKGEELSEYYINGKRCE
ncbi:MAG: 8-oxo-dGTP diphosphatase [Clostridia bacterium]|nr:8-oxo-dGTP diphosphatase [Clostridia bacterium]